MSRTEAILNPANTRLRHESSESPQPLTKERVRLLISCADGPGIVAAISQFLFIHGANIVRSDQHTTDPASGLFFMRVEADFAEYDHKATIAAFDEVARHFDMTWRIERAGHKKQLALFVSKTDHCLLELLWQWKAGNLNADIAFIVSNHPDLKPIANDMGIPYYHLPISKETRAAVEAKQMELIDTHHIDLVVLARYMQILSPKFTAAYPQHIINIHHSFLPAFIGRNPYGRAYERGVKLIGATAHYVTDSLDEGPIIEQDVARVNHRDQVNDLKRIGKTIERVVLARAVKWHVEDRILTYGNKTVVFS